MSSASSVSADTSTLSWQSAYFAVAALALNNAARPSGMVNGMRSTQSFFLRIGPVFCAFDALATLTYLLADTIHTRSLLTAALCWETRRNINNDPDGDDESNYKKINKYFFIRMIVFVLGPLTQLIKLYACTGIPWVQALASIYAINFVVDEVVSGLANIARMRPIPWLRLMSVTLPPLSTGQMMLLCDLVLAACWANSLAYLRKGESRAWPAFLPHFFSVLPFADSMTPAEPGSYVVAILWCAFMAGNYRWEHYLLWSPLAMHPILKLILSILGLIVWALCLGYAALVVGIVGPMAPYRLQQRASHFVRALKIPAERYLGMYFVVLALIGALTFAKAYDAEQSSRPLWTEVFG